MVMTEMAGKSKRDVGETQGLVFCKKEAKNFLTRG
jgi:hypothetical protein